MSDTLFPLNEAMRTYAALDAAGVDVRLHTHLGGHVAPYAQPLGTSAARRTPSAESGPCGSTEDAVVAWMREKLQGGPPSGIPRASFALEDGRCVARDGPAGATREATAALALAPAGAGSTLVPLAEGPLVVAGVPTLRAQVDATAPGGVVFASLVVVGADGFTRVVNDQSMPLRALPGAALASELAGVATALGPGERLLLRLDGLNEWYLHNGARAPGAALLRDVVVALPVLDEA